MIAESARTMRRWQLAQCSLLKSAVIAPPLHLCLMFLLSLAIAAQAGADEQQRLPGKFVWTELVTYDSALSEKFYGALFDWEFADEGDYRVAWRGEEAIGGFVQRPRQDPAGKSRWIAYISVVQMDKARAALQAAGVQSLSAPRQVEGLGELEVYADREGALFGIIDSAVPDPGDYLADVGDWIWIQLFSRDATQASAFYAQVGGYQRIDNPHNPGAYLLAREGYARAAISTLSAQHRDAVPSWVPFLRVADLAATLQKANALGGKTLIAPRADLYDNRVAMIEAPDGSAVGLLVWQADATEGAQ